MPFLLRRRQWSWLLAIVAVGALAISALLVVHEREQDARAKEQVARIAATRIQDVITDLTPVGGLLMQRDPKALDILLRRGAESASGQVRLLRAIDPRRADAMTALFAQVLRSSDDGRFPRPIEALTLSSRVQRLATEIAEHEHARAERAERQALYGSIGALAFAVLLVAVLLRGERSLVLRAARLHADEIDELAHRDSLTGLENRRRLDERLEALGGPSNGPVEIAVCDLNGFKSINDQLGHHAGDAVLVTAARDLLAAVGDDGVVYRTGGDEFCVVSLPGRRIGDATRGAFARPDRADIASVGVATWPADHALPHGVIRVADQRMYLVKRAIRGDSRRAGEPHEA